MRAFAIGAHDGHPRPPYSNAVPGNMPPPVSIESRRHTETGLVTLTEAESTCRNDPVNMLTGEELFSHLDFELPGPIPLSWKRLYRSSAINQRSELGHGWSHPFNQYLTLKEGQLLHHDPEGALVTYPLPETGQRLRNQWGAVLSRYDDYLSLKQDGVVLGFEPDPWHPKRWRLSQLFTPDFHHHWHLHYKDDESLGESRLSGALSSWGAELRFESGRHGWQRVLGRPNHRAAERVLARYRVCRHGDLLAATDQRGCQEQFRYTNHLFVRRRTASGLTFHFQWDQLSARARCVRQYADDGSYDYRFEWSPQTRTSRATNSRGHMEKFVFNALGQLVRHTRPDGHTEHWEYDSQGKLRCHTDPLSRKTRYKYDNKGRLTARTNPLGHTVRLQYWRDKHLPSQIIDPMGQRTQYHYTPQGLLTTIRHPDGSEEHWTYKGERLIRYRDRQERIHRYHWNERFGCLAQYECLARSDSPSTLNDEMGRLLTLVNLYFDYDEEGRLRTQRDQNSREHHFYYDTAGRLVTHTDDADQSWHFGYDSAGRLVSQTDPNGHVSHRRYGNHTQPESRCLPGGREIHYEYDTERKLTAVINHNGQAHRFGYDATGQLIRETGINGRTTQYRYNAAGQLIALIEGPIQADFEINALGQLLREHYRNQDHPGADCWAEYDYDAAGRLVKACNPHAEHQWHYDSTGRLIEDRIRQFFPLDQDAGHCYHHWQSFDYNHNGLLAAVHHQTGTGPTNPQQTEPDAFESTRWSHRYEWHPEGRLRRLGITLPGEAKLWGQTDTSVLDQPMNTRQDVPFPGMAQQWQHRDEQRLQHYQRLNSGDADRPLPVYRQPGPAARLARIMNPRHYHDDLDYLVQAQTHHPRQLRALTEHHGIDTSAHRLPQGLEQLLDDRLSSHGARQFAYDAHGNLIRVSRNDDRPMEQRLRYNAKHQLVEIDEYQQGQWHQRLNFRYDALGRRIEKIVYRRTADTEAPSPEPSRVYSEAYVWQGQALLQVRHIGKQSEPVNNRIYVYQPDTLVPVALWDEALGLMHFDTDPLGTPTALYRHTDGEEIWNVEHSHQGEAQGARRLVTHPATGTRFDPGLRFQGLYEDLESGLFQNLTHYYDPDAGCFLSQDCVGLLSGHTTYQYCPDPAEGIDPIHPVPSKMNPH